MDNECLERANFFVSFSFRATDGSRECLIQFNVITDASLDAQLYSALEIPEREKIVEEIGQVSGLLRDLLVTEAEIIQTQEVRADLQDSLQDVPDGEAKSHVYRIFRGA